MLDGCAAVMSRAAAADAAAGGRLGGLPGAA